MNKKWKNVSISECFGIILRSLICFLIVAVPISFDPLKLSYEILPGIGSGDLVTIFSDTASVGFPAVLSALSNYTDYFSLAYKIVILGYFGALVLNVFNALILILTRHNGLRAFFRVISSICGVFFILGCILFLGYFVALYGMFTQGLDFSALISDCAALYAVAGFIFCIVMGLNQFEYFKKPYIY